MRKPQPRYIRPESIGIGDTIKVAVQIEDTAVARVGVVAAREYQGSLVRFLTKAGMPLLEYVPGVTMNHYRITRLDRADEPQTILDGFEQLEVDLNAPGRVPTVRTTVRRPNPRGYGE